MTTKSRLARIERRLPPKPKPAWDLLHHVDDLPDALAVYVVERCVDPDCVDIESADIGRLKAWLGCASGWEAPADREHLADDWCLNVLAKTTRRAAGWERVPTLDEVHADLLMAAQLRLSAWLHPPPHKWAGGLHEDRAAWEALVGPITDQQLGERDTICHHMFDDEVVRRWRTRPGGPSPAIVALAGLDEHTVRFLDSSETETAPRNP